MMKSVELFFAFDDGYAPLAAVTMLSVKENRDRRRNYNLHILHTGLGERTVARLSSQLSEQGFELYFHDISWAALELCNLFHTRDYYSKSTYYRMFIPRLFPDIDKGLYIDCDTVVTTDIAELYDVELGNCLVGAVPDGAVAAVPEFRDYVSMRLGIPYNHYFNAGVLLMNLSLMRKVGLENSFRELISRVKFDVAQDQDYLNVICRGAVLELDEGWNRMPVRPEEACERIKLIHFNLDQKPWHRRDVLFSDEFWRYARRSPLRSSIEKDRRSYSESDLLRDAAATERLIMTAHAEAHDASENARIARIIDRVLGERMEAAI